MKSATSLCPSPGFLSLDLAAQWSSVSTKTVRRWIEQGLPVHQAGLSPQAELYDQKLQEQRLNPHHHMRKIVALSDIYTPQAVARAMQDALLYEAFSSDYIANLVEQRARFTPEASPLHLTRRQDLLEVHLQPPDLSLYQATPQPESTPTQETHDVDNPRQTPHDHSA